MRSVFRVAFVLVVMTFALSRFAFTSPALAASITCNGDMLVEVIVTVLTSADYRLAGSGPGTPSYIVNTVSSGTFELSWVLAGPGSWNIDLETSFAGANYWTLSIYSDDLVLTCYEEDEQVAGPPAANLLDGRLNSSQLKDVAAPVAVYCADGNLDIYKIDAATGAGTRIISVVQVEGTPESTQLLAESAGVSLYWLDTSEYLLNTPNFEGKPYSITWIGCDTAALTHHGA